MNNFAFDDTLSSSSVSFAHTTSLAPLTVIKRTGQAVPFDENKISLAISKAFVAVEGEKSLGSERMRDSIAHILQDITNTLYRRYPAGGQIHIEDIQDMVELGLMRHQFHQVARAYVLYRESHRQQRDARETDEIQHAGVHRQEEQQTTDDIRSLLAQACQQLTAVDQHKMLDHCRQVLHHGLDDKDKISAMIMAIRPLIELDPDYSFVCARLLIQQLWQQAGAQVPEAENLKGDYAGFFLQLVPYGVQQQILDSRLAEFDLPRLATALKPERDVLFDYLGMQTLFDRYFLHVDEQRIELPQTFYMRVAMGLALNEADKNTRAIEFYELLSSHDYMVSTPTLFNAGTTHPQLSSCYLTTVDDDLDAIYSAIKDNALLSKWAGGLGNDWTPVRALGARIKGTNGLSQGVVPFLKVANDTAVAVNQGGKRKGAVCAYLESWHLDIEEFLELRKNTGDERRRTHDMNSANWIPDLFLKRVIENKPWTLFSPHEVSDLHDLFGSAFEQRYVEYEQLAEQGKMSLSKTLQARELWRKMLSMLFETGHPWIAFKDACNIRSPQQHCGVVHSSNLCTEITLNTAQDEIAVCNLGSINLVNHLQQGALDKRKLQQTITTALRMLDNVIDINFYAVDTARESNLKHRPVGLGMMGFQDALYALNISYASEQAVHFADHSMELISYYAIQASATLAAERGPYASFAGSLWDQGILPIDSQKILAKERGKHYWSGDSRMQLDWQPIRQLIARHGMRHSNVMAIAPTATISNIVGVSQSIEPTFQNLFVKSNLSGEFTQVNPWLVKVLKQQGLWDEVMVNDLKYYEGELQAIKRIPDDIKQLFATAFEIDSRWLVEAAARRQKWIDQSQSLNLYMADASGKKLDNLFKLAWSRGLKTTYYLRSRAATTMEKHELPSSTDADNEAATFCSITEPDCEACQ